MLGLDIGSKSIKVIETAQSGDKWVLKTSGIVAYSGNSPDKFQDDKEYETLAEIVKKLINQIKVSDKNVNIGLPEAQVFTRTIRFPLLSDEEISAAVKWESEQYIPIPANEAIIQYSVLEKDEKTASVSVLLVAAPKVVVEKYVKISRLAGLMPTSAETELIALNRSVSPMQGTALVLDLGASYSNIAISKDSNLVFSRSVPVAGDALSRALSQTMELNTQQSDEYKKTYGLSKDQLDGKVRVSLEPIVNVLIEEIKKVIHFYQTEEKGQLPTSVILSGGTSMMNDLAPSISNSLGLETLLADPFQRIQVDQETLKSLKEFSPYYGVACGLAMR